MSCTLTTIVGNHHITPHTGVKLVRNPTGIANKASLMQPFNLGNPVTLYRATDIDDDYG